MCEQKDEPEAREGGEKAEIHSSSPVLDPYDVETLLGGVEITLASSTLHQTDPA